MDSARLAAYSAVAGESSAHGGAKPAHTLRPTVIRRDTEQILSYYQSADAGRAYEPPVSQDHHLNGTTRRRQMSSGSTSPSDYSDDNDGVEHRSIAASHQERQPEAGEGNHRRQRSRVRSDGGEDKRRIALVQVESSSRSHDMNGASGQRSPASTPSRGTSPGSAVSLLSQRGMDAHLKGLALVAPPDASPRSYSDLTPPPSAPAEGARHGNAAFPGPSSWGHQRSASEIPRTTKNGSIRRKSSRDVGVVGTGGPSVPDQPSSNHALRERSQLAEGGGNLQPPIFLTPQSRSPSPGSRQDSDSESTHRRGHSPLGQRVQAKLAVQGHTGYTPPLLTPGIGQEKEIHQPVAGPVVVDLESRLRGAVSPMSPPNNTMAEPSPSPSPNPACAPDFSAYLNYEPGVHATAGPLPPPPRAVFDIDAQSPPPPRPPRLHSPPPINTRRRPDTDPVRQPMQLSSTSNSQTLRPETSRVSLKRGNSDFSIMAVSVHSGDDRSPPEVGASETEEPHAVHLREGAFPPSTFIQPNRSDDTGYKESDSRDMGNTPQARQSGNGDATVDGQASPLTMTIEPPEDDLSRLPDSNLRHAKSQSSLGHEFSHLQISSPGGASSSSYSSSSPPPPDASVHQRYNTIGEGFPGSLDNAAWINMKRFSSLPRTPSGASGGRSSSGLSTRTPSPSHNLPQAAQPPKIISRWPNAMYYGDVVTRKSALERAMGYAHKINELAMYDCGLGAWVTAKKHPGGVGGSGSRVGLSPTGPALPSTLATSGQPRHTSHGSQASEATFPRRPDAYLATDLSSKPTDDISPPTGPPPTLPYPSLATPRTPSSRLSTIPSSPASPRSLPSSLSKAPGAAFFSSIGRKTSVRKERGLGPSGRLLMKAPPNTPPAPRPVQIQNAPSVPGGPRAPPGRMQRSQTLGLSPGSSTDSSQSPPTSLNWRESTAAKRPSFFGVSRSSPSRLPETEFEKQLDKLADLLPQEDRAVLAGYLRRSGQDIVAIGQYLEDEKNGTIRRD